ncbi:MAG: hypothetical protein C4536_05690 [Actinobacteria bacterium]|jgi:hypothetical protein|nr:MAG: hypothetical protein C4536_05690 [Actinomycetota bacterium]
MKRKLMVIAGLCTVVALLSLSVFAGCGSDASQETATQSGEEATAEFAFPDEDLMGYPLYRENVDKSSVKSNKEESDGEVQEITLDYKTSDSYDTVLAFYKEEVGVPTQTSELAGGYSRAMYDMDEGGYHTVIVITQIKDATAISVMREKQL